MISVEQRNRIIELGNLGYSAWSSSKLVGCSSTFAAELFRQHGIKLKPKGFQRKYPINDELFSPVATSEAAYIAGLIAADGSIGESKGRTPWLNLRLKEEDSYLLQQIANILSPEQPLKLVYGTPKPNNNFQGRTVNTGASYTLAWRSKKHFDSLQALGITPRKSKTISGVTSQIPQVYKADFIRGYFDGNGCAFATTRPRKDRGNKMQTRYRVDFCCGSLEFVEDLKLNINELANLTCGYFSNHSGSAGYHLCYEGKKTMSALHKLLYNPEPSLFLERKHNKFQIN